jgi:hypothetical protein
MNLRKRINFNEENMIKFPGARNGITLAEALPGYEYLEGKLDKTTKQEEEKKKSFCKV